MVPAVSSKHNGQLHQQWTSIQMPPTYTVRAPIGLAGVYKHSGQQSTSAMTSHGRNSMQLLQQSTHGEPLGMQKVFSIAITSQYVRYGKRGPPNSLRSWP